MGYFANGTEGDDYEATYCEKCVHNLRWQKLEKDPCPVWNAHLAYSYELCNEKEHPGKVILDSLIPRSGVFNDGCKMFVPVEALTKQARAAMLKE